MNHSLSPFSTKSMLLAGVAAFMLPSAAIASDVDLTSPAAIDATDVDELDEDDLDLEYDDDIVVTAPRLSGQLETNIRPVVEFDEDAIASYGVSSISELLEAIESQTRSGRGRGGRPIMLVNGRRTNGFDSVRNIPPEAVAKVEVFPEEVALQYGYAATERVVNIVLKPNFKQMSMQIEGGIPTAGGRFQSELEPTFIAISERGRININAGWEHNSMLLESDRNLNPTSGIAADSAARSLLPRSDTYVIDGTFVRNIDRLTDATLSVRFDQTDSLALLGLADNGLGLARRRETRNQNITTSASFNGMWGTWRWAVTGNYADADVRTFTERDGGVRDRTDSSQQTFGANANLSGTITEGWAGPIRASVTSGYSGLRFNSRTDQGRRITTSDLARDTFGTLGSVTVPLLDPDYDVGKIGRVSLTLSAAAEKPSDFSLITSWGSSINWGLTDRLSFIASYNRDETAPSVSQLGATPLETDGVLYYDFSTGQTTEITTVTGGNPNLLRETRRDIKFGVNWEVPFVEGMRFSADYNRNRSSDTANSLPLLTPEIEAAFGDRVIRVNGVLTYLDTRPVNFMETENSQIRYGVNFGRSFAQNNAVAGPARGGGAADGARSRGDGTAPPREGAAPAGERSGPGGRALCVPTASAEAPLVGGTIEGAVAPTREAAPEGAAEGTPPTLSCPADMVLRRIPAPEGQADGRGGATPPMGGGRVAGAGPSAGAGAGARGPGGGFGPPLLGGQRGGGRWQASIFHTIKLTDTVLIGRGVPELDLLNGSATGENGGSNRNLIEAEGGLFYKGIGTRLTAKYDSGTSVIGGANGDLRFHDLGTINIRVFAVFDQIPKVVEKLPVLKNSRLRLSVDNIFDARRKVSDDSGVVPLNYQPGYLDPLGRYVELNWRKSF